MLAELRVQVDELSKQIIAASVPHSSEARRNQGEAHGNSAILR